MAVRKRADLNDDRYARTLDLSALAQVRRGEEVRVQALADKVDELYQRTVQLLPADEQYDDRGPRPRGTTGRRGRRPSPVVPPPAAHLSEEFVPNDDELRRRYLLAEAVGGYEALHDLLNVYSPGLALVRRYAAKVETRGLGGREVRALEEYQAQIRSALAKANHYLANNSLERFSREEIHELHDLLTMASKRDKELTRILGAHLIHEVEAAIYRLNELTVKIHSVERTISGIFLVDSEVMFIPTTELIKTVNSIFKAVGNPYLAQHIDGVMLLAARNLLIEVVAFFSYYGKHQIYNLFQKGGTSTSITAISFRIRAEIRKLFAACMRDNKLVLTRVMEDTAREFELSVDAIQKEAEESAVDAVRRIIPPDLPKTAPIKRGWLRRLLGWFV